LYKLNPQGRKKEVLYDDNKIEWDELVSNNGGAKARSASRDTSGDPLRLQRGVLIGMQNHGKRNRSKCDDLKSI
jgi:hypothetical protein